MQSKLNHTTDSVLLDVVGSNIFRHNGDYELVDLSINPHPEYGEHTIRSMPDGVILYSDRQIGWEAFHHTDSHEYPPYSYGMWYPSAEIHTVTAREAVVDYGYSINRVKEIADEDVELDVDY